MLVGYKAEQPTHRPVGLLTVRAAAVEGHPADAAVVVVGHPGPGGHSAPVADLHLHLLPRNRTNTRQGRRWRTVQLSRWLAVVEHTLLNK